MALDPLELKLGMVVNHNGGAVNGPRVLAAEPSLQPASV